MSDASNHWSEEFPTVGDPRIQYDRIYWPIELDELDKCSAYGCLDPFTWIFLGWIAQRVDTSLALSNKGIHLTVIEVEYVSRYPCLAVYSAEKDHRGCSIIPDEVAGDILREIRKTIETTSVKDMVAQISWEDAKSDQSAID